MSEEAIARIAGEWRSAERKIGSIEAATPPLDGPAQRLEKLYAAMDESVARLRTRPPKAATTPVDAETAAANLRRARQQLGEAEEFLGSLAKESRDAAESAGAWERRAMLAVEAGSDELAREALARRAEMASMHRRLRREVDAGEAALAEMRSVLEQMASACDGSARR